jgi:hypothetical protein
MTDGKFAAKQIKRLAVLKWFPKGEAVKELLRALMAADTDIIAVAVINDIVDYAEECPTPAAIRRRCWELNEKRSKLTKECRLCGGFGQVTVWLLVTYSGRSLVVKHKQEILSDFDAEKAKKLGKQLRWDDGPITKENPFLGDNQQIVTGAKPCSCRNPMSTSTQVADGFNDCQRCQGCGYYGGEMGGQYDGPWKWCDCTAARAKQATDPDLVSEANAARTHLQKLDGKLIRKVGQVEREPYHGSF